MFEFTKPAPVTVTLLPEIGPEDGMTALKTALKLTGVNGMMVTFPLIEPEGAGGQHVKLDG
jgi:hypothetical protein